MRISPPADLPRGIPGHHPTPGQVAELNRLVSGLPPFDPTTDVLPRLAVPTGKLEEVVRYFIPGVVEDWRPPAPCPPPPTG